MARKHHAGEAVHTEHSPHLQHHFDTPVQQYDSAKMGMWLFLATEVLLFSGLFCAYAVYRSNHPEVFAYASRFLDTTLGALNTCVLLFSSLTAAWAVRAAQLGQRKLLIALLSITLVCGFGFLGVKYVEYSAKWTHGLLWGARYNPAEHGEEGAAAEGVAGHAAAEGGATAGAVEAARDATDADAKRAGVEGTAAADNATGDGAQAEAAPAPAAPAQAAIGPRGLTEEAVLNPDFGTDDVIHIEPDPQNVQLFFSVYFGMTGLHAIHVIAGMIVLAWLLIRAMKGEFGPRYYTPVDLGILYWHLVDLIWIFLFPLLYLID